MCHVCNILTSWKKKLSTSLAFHPFMENELLQWFSQSEAAVDY